MPFFTTYAIGRLDSGYLADALLHNILWYSPQCGRVLSRLLTCFEIGSLSRDVSMHINRKWAAFSFNMPWRSLRTADAFLVVASYDRKCVCCSQTSLDATKCVLLSVFTHIETIWPKICSKSGLKRAKRPLPVDVRGSKTLLHKLLNEKKWLKSTRCLV